jgi:hypothetical protein
VRTGTVERTEASVSAAHGKAQAEVSLPLGRKVSFAHSHGVDVPDRALGLLDGAQSHHQGVDELLEVILEEGQVHEVVLHHVCVGLVIGAYKTCVVQKISSCDFY